MINKKRYMLNDNITVEKLEKNNFIEDGMIREIEDKYSYIKKLIDEIELHVEIGINKDGSFKFNDGNHILLIDKSIYKVYYPFYLSDKEDKYLDKVIIEYNKAMDELVKKGILKELKLEKEKVKKLYK